jgi:hypothetical protein
MKFAITQGEGTPGARDRRFGTSFMSTRRRPQPALVNPQNIRRGMQVYDYDGTYVGFVTGVLEKALLLRAGWRAELEVPLEHVLAVLDQRVLLTVSVRSRERGRQAA